MPSQPDCPGFAPSQPPTHPVSSRQNIHPCVTVSGQRAVLGSDGLAGGRPGRRGRYLSHTPSRTPSHTVSHTLSLSRSRWWPARAARTVTSLSHLLFRTQCGALDPSSVIDQSWSGKQGRDGACPVPGHFPAGMEKLVRGQAWRSSGGRSRGQTAPCKSSCECMRPEPCPRRLFSEMLDRRA